MNGTTQVLLEVFGERGNQDRKFGPARDFPDGTTASQADVLAAKAARDLTDYHTDFGLVTWALILSEEFHEALAETDPDKLRTELIQVAAVATAWVEAIDARQP